MADAVETIVDLPIKVKPRVGFIGINNGVANKSIRWELELRPIKPDDSYGTVVGTDAVLETPEALAYTVAPVGTVVEIAPGVALDISGISGAHIHAWILWHGADICAARAGAMIAAVTGA